MSYSSALFAALVGLVLLYLVPNRARTKQILLEARQDDRFSPELRVIARASKKTAKEAAQKTTPKVGEITASPPRNGYVLTQTISPENTMMRRPNVVADRMAAQNAAERQRRRAQLAQRTAAARRRLALTVVLLLATIASGVTVAVTSLSVFLVAVPGALLVSVLTLGRRAVVLNKRADARYERLQVARAQDLAAAEVAEPELEQAPAPAEEIVEEVVAVADEADAELEATWTPVPVPAPSYTLKPQAPRMEPAPLDLPEPNYIAVSARGAESDLSLSADAPSVAHSGAAANVAEESAAAASAEAELDLDAILDRRRAAGA